MTLAKDSLNAGKRFRQACWFAGLILIAAAVSSQLTADFFSSLERRFYDVASTSTSTSSSRVPADRVEVIAVDDQNIANIGRWPWPRDVDATLIDQLSEARVKTIVDTVFSFGSHADRCLVVIRKIQDLLARSSTNSTMKFTAGRQSTREQLSKGIAESEQALDTDAIRANSIRRAGNVLLTSAFVLGEPQGKAGSALSAFAVKSAVDETQAFSVSATKSQQPLAALGNAAAGVFHLSHLQDIGGAVRNEMFLVDYFGKAVPSCAAPDIKPANIMYDLSTDTVKVTDFGIARITDSSKTKTGMVLGTPSFMSLDGRSDQYSLGVMLFQMLAGVLPFRGESLAQLMYRIANEDAPDIREMRRDLPESLADLLALSLNKRPETRYQNGDHFAADLRAIIASMPSSADDVPVLTARLKSRGNRETSGSTSSENQALTPYEKTMLLGAGKQTASNYQPGPIRAHFAQASFGKIELQVAALLPLATLSNARSVAPDIEI